MFRQKISQTKLPEFLAEADGLKKQFDEPDDAVSADTVHDDEMEAFWRDDYFTQAVKIFLSSTHNIGDQLDSIYDCAPDDCEIAPSLQAQFSREVFLYNSIRHRLRERGNADASARLLDKVLCLGYQHDRPEAFISATCAPQTASSVRRVEMNGDPEIFLHLILNGSDDIRRAFFSTLNACKPDDDDVVF